MFILLFVEQLQSPERPLLPTNGDEGRKLFLTSAGLPLLPIVDGQMGYRDKSIPVKSGILGVTVAMDPEFPDLLTAMWVSLPARGLAFPLYMGCEATPGPLLDGTVYEICRQTGGIGSLEAG